MAVDSGDRVGVRLLVSSLVLIGFVFACLFAAAAPAPAADWSISDCTSCHTAYPNAHSLDNCLSCHGLYNYTLDPGDGHYYTADRPAGSCANGGTCHVNGFEVGVDTYAHGYWLGWDDPPGPYDYYPESPISHYSDQYNGIWSNRVYSCDFCHSASYPHIYSHDGAALEAAHLADIAGTSCEDCHSNQLADEVGHVTCNTCHASSDPAVIAAIDNWDGTCITCHPGFATAHEAAHENIAVPECTDCHEGSVEELHADCMTCHADPVPAGATCITCHPTFTDPHGNVLRTWGYEDYYSWFTIGRDGVMLRDVGDNPLFPGVHGNYTANTAKCGICHSVHRAYGDGVKLLATAEATCAACHRAGATTVTDVVVSWESGGPHGSGTSANCTQRACHMDNPHGAGGSDYVIVAAKLLNPATDVQLAVAAARPASGITTDDLNALGTWDEATRSAVRTGYNCNIEGCHFQTLLAVLQEGYSEDRWSTYNDPSAGFDGHGPMVAKTGHLSVALANNETAFSPVDSCISCHDQTDSATGYDMNGWSTVSGYTFPHSQTAYGDSNVGTGNRAWLWMTVAANAGGDDFGYFEVATDKAKDGACLKCHRAIGDAAGIGIDR